MNVFQSELNREGWLTEVARKSEKFFSGFKILPYRVTCGWPSTAAMASKQRRLGECHGPKVSKAGVAEVFISPLLDKPLEVAGTLCHELAHVIAGVEAKHGKGFIRVCKHAGLVKGHPRSVMPGERLNESLSRIIDKLGVYPHKAIILREREDKKIVRKNPTLELWELWKEMEGGEPIKLVCECGCPVLMPAKWYETVGAPLCACGRRMLQWRNL
jgi:hypothetical protein